MYPRGGKQATGAGDKFYRVRIKTNGNIGEGDVVRGKDYDQDKIKKHGRKNMNVRRILPCEDRRY